MKNDLKRRPDPIATLRVHIIQLQERAAKLAREGRKAEARKVRDSLIGHLNRLDMLRAGANHLMDE
jgi:hypothetical protein